MCNCSKILGNFFFSVREIFYNNISCISYSWKSVCHFQVRHVEVKKNFKVRAKSACFLKKISFFKIFKMKSSNTFKLFLFKKKLWKLTEHIIKGNFCLQNVFQKNQNWILQSRLKFSNFQKIAILRKWKYPIFVPKVYKIIKLRQLFLSKCPQNKFKIFTLMDFCVSLIFFLKENPYVFPRFRDKSTCCSEFDSVVKNVFLKFCPPRNVEKSCSYHHDQKLPDEKTLCLMINNQAQDKTIIAFFSF